jgi:hypothetical protein
MGPGTQVRSLIRPHKLWPVEVQQDAMIGDEIYVIAKRQQSRETFINSLRAGDVVELHWLFLLAESERRTEKWADLIHTLRRLDDIGVDHVRESATNRTTECRQMREHMELVAHDMIRRRGHRPRWDYPPTIMGRPRKLTPEQKAIARVAWFDRRLKTKAEVIGWLATHSINIHPTTLYRLFGQRT